MPFVWELDTSPFSSEEGTQPGRIVLRQVDDDTFELVEPFSFTNPDGRVFPVEPDLLGRTDLASIPSFLAWFARRHGRHTPAALLHDLLITDDPEGLPEELRVSPEEADLLFRQALLASDVALVKAWVLYAGVAARTRWCRRPLGAIGLAVWFAVALAVTGVFGWGLLQGWWRLIVVGFVAPVPASLLWGRQWAAGLVAGYAFWLVMLGSAPAWVAYQVYRVIEYVALWIRRLRPANRSQPLPPPVAYKKR
jgi:Protein of unknown function (DUF1353)